MILKATAAMTRRLLPVLSDPDTDKPTTFRVPPRGTANQTYVVYAENCGVRIGVPACLRKVQFFAATCSHEASCLQALSAQRQSLQASWQDF